MIYLELFFIFFIIGTFTVGGGYAMLSLIHANVVLKQGWITDQAFTDIVAISQMTPGPIGINSATYVGYSVLEGTGASNLECIMGSFTATMAVVLPSFLIVVTICKAYNKFKTNQLFIRVLNFIKPVVVGLIAAAVIMLIKKESFPEYTSWILFAASFCIVFWTKISPIYILTTAGIIGLFLY